MPTATPQAPKTADPRQQRILLAVALVLLVPSLYFIWRHFRTHGVEYETVAGRPLLKNESNRFHDQDSGIRFRAPTNWSLQLRTTEAPDAEGKERLIVKYKRLLPKQGLGWLRVYVTDRPKNKSIVEAVAERDPGAGFKPLTKVESRTIAGVPAASISHSNVYHNAISVRDVIGLEYKDRIFFFVATYPAADKGVRDEINQSVNSVVFSD